MLETIWCKCLTIQILKNGVISDKEKFDNCCCLPVKCAIILFLLLLHALVAVPFDKQPEGSGKWCGGFFLLGKV